MAKTNLVGKHKTKVVHEADRMIVRYHNTNVVTVTDNEIILDTGGYKTVTTKLRMNQTSNEYALGYRVYQRNFVWLCDYRGKLYQFKNNKCILNLYGDNNDESIYRVQSPM